MAVTGMHLGGAIARALGLPPETTDILINVGLDEPVSVLCRYYPSADAVEQIVGVLTRYHLEIAGGEATDDLFAQEQRIRLFRRGLLRGEGGIESPYLQKYLALKAELEEWIRLGDHLGNVNDTYPSPAVDTTMIYKQIARLEDLIARMEAGEAV